MSSSNVRYKSVGINATLNVIKTLMLIVFPLITYPYVTRVLQPENLGKVNYAQSVISYFALIATLGISTYAVREGARIREKKTELNRFASQVFSFNIITTIVSYLVLIITIVIVKQFHDYTLLFMIESTTILFTTIGVDWINVIYEDYLYITLRSILLHVLSLIFLFLFVKTSEDYYIYAIINVSCQGFISILNFIHVRKYCSIRITGKLDLKEKIKPIMILFSNSLAVKIYVSADTTMLGLMTADYNVGLYSVAVKIYTIIKQLIAAIYSVIVSRMSYYYAEGKIEEFKKLLNNVINTLIVVSVPITLGLVFTSEEIIMILSGEKYIEAVPSLQILSFTFLFAVLGGMFANCVNLPLKREKFNLIATVISAVENIVLNLVLIPIMKQNGAALTNLLAEMTVCFVIFFGLRKHFDLFNFRSILLNIIKCLISGSSIILVWWVNKNILHFGGVLYLVAMVAFSALLYVGINILLKNEWIKIALDSIFGKIIKKFKKK